MANPAVTRSTLGSIRFIRKSCTILESPFGTCIREQRRTIYQSRQPWHADSNPILERARYQDPDFDNNMGDLSDTARGFTLPAIPTSLPNHPVGISVPPSIAAELSRLRLPRAVQSAYLRPLHRAPQSSSSPTVCTVQFRSYSPVQLNLAVDLAIRAAYYLYLPCSGGIPLPRIVERWTVPKANFIFKKSQENFERRTCRRMLSLKEGDAETVQCWLGFLAKYSVHGVGMRAEVFEYGGVDTAKEMDGKVTDEVKEKIKERLELVGRRRDFINGSKRLQAETKHLIHDSLWKGMYGSMGPGGASRYRRER